MASKSFTLTLGFLAAISFATLPGCTDPSTTTVTEATDADHGHEDDGHSHDGDDHAHAEDAHGHDHGDEGHSDAAHNEDGHSHAEHDDHAHAHGHGEAQAEEHDHDFKTLAEAVKEVVSLRDTIRDGFAEDDTESAHDPLHHMGEVLIATENLIKTMDDSDAKTAAAAAVESLLDDFNAVDESLHSSDENNSKGKSYDEVSKSVDEAIEILKASAE